ncbi:hypothetical protein GEMRC1_012534 [Eukaryota sp. GEM-RC1]
MRRDGSMFRLDSSSVPFVINDQLYLFGGDYFDQVENSILEFDPELLDMTPTYADFNLVSPSMTTPPRTFGHSAVVVGTKMFVLGGSRPFSRDIRDMNVYYFDLMTYSWNYLEVQSSYAPPLRVGHCSVVYGTRIVQFGGETVSTSDLTNDVIFFDHVSREFTWFVTEGSPPSPRSYACCSVYEHSLIVYGGATASSRSSEFYSLNLQTGRWTQISQTSEEVWPPPMDRCSLLVAQTDDSYVMLIGGRDDSRNANQTYLWKISPDSLTRDGSNQKDGFTNLLDSETRYTPST